MQGRIQDSDVISNIKRSILSNRTVKHLMEQLNTLIEQSNTLIGRSNIAIVMKKHKKMLAHAILRIFI